MRFGFTVAISSVLFCTGCANFTPPLSKRQIPAEGTFWLTYDASRRGTLIAMDQGKISRSCAEPAPDIARSFSNIFGSLSDRSTNKQGTGAALTASVTPLPGRNDLVLLAREALFRLCEARGNQDISRERYADIFEDVLEHVKAIAEIEMARSHMMRDDAPAPTGSNSAAHKNESFEVPATTTVPTKPLEAPKP